jgi:hypothetical protein
MGANTLITLGIVGIWDRLVIEPRFQRLEAIAAAITKYYVQPIAKRHGIAIPQQERPQQKR